MTTAELPTADSNTAPFGRGAPTRHRSARLAEKSIQWLFLAPAIVYVAMFFGYPIVQNVRMSFENYSTRTFFTGQAPWVGWANYVTVIKSSLFKTTLINTGLFTVGSIVGQFIIGLALALFFRRKFPLNNLLRSLLLLPWLLPIIASTAVWKWMLDQDSGILNHLLGFLHISAVPWLVSPNVALIAVVMVNIWLGIPFNVAILYSGLQDVPTELYEAGSLDGATGWKAFRFITWPSLRPVVTVVLVLGVVYTLKVLDIIIGLTGGGPANATETLAAEAYRRSFVEFSFGTGAAVSNILIVVSLVFAFVYLRLNRRAIDE
jgi:multiple sugar transport system permease protein